MTAFIILSVITVLIIAYVVGGREWLRAQPWAANFFSWIEPVEIKLFRKSVSLLWARFLQFIGVFLTLISSLGAFDLSPVFVYLPDKYKWVPAMLPLIISVAGVIQENLRRFTSKPLELVEVSEKELAKPEVAVAIETAEAAKFAAVSEVTQNTRSA